MNAALSITQQRHSRMRILPRVWATASLASASVAVQERKRPHCLRLVKAASPLVEFKAPTAQRSPIAGLVFYREYTEAMLRRYVTLSMESGRVPSLLGRELFRGNVTSYKVTAFDDSVIFVADVGRCLEQLDSGLRHLVRRIALEGYTREETAGLLGVSLRTVARRYGEAIDKLTRIMLDREILKPMMASRMEEA
jgi:hypothetical protein